MPGKYCSLRLILFLFLALTIILYGQRQSVAYDTLIAQLSSSLPFDQPFVVKYVASGQANVRSADLFGLDNNGRSYLKN